MIPLSRNRSSKTETSHCHCCVVPLNCPYNVLHIFFSIEVPFNNKKSLIKIKFQKIYGRCLALFVQQLKRKKTHIILLVQRNIMFEAVIEFEIHISDSFNHCSHSQFYFRRCSCSDLIDHRSHHRLIKVTATNSPHHRFN